MRTRAPRQADQSTRCLLVGCAILWMAGSGCRPQDPPPPKPDPDDRIVRIEGGLLGAIQIRDRVPRRFSIEDRMEFYRVPGVSVAVIHEGAIEWARAYGHANVGTERPVTSETLFQAASISKPVAALAALRLVEEGRIDLDEGIDAYLTSWRVPRDREVAQAEVTLRRLLTHTAGLTVHGFRGYAEGERVPTVLQVLAGASPANSERIRVDTDPGTSWRYSGGGYTVMQQLVEDLTGRSFEGVMREVLDSLGMRQSTYEQPLPPGRRATAATGYRSDGTPVVGSWHTYPERAAAGLWTTPSDLARYAVAVGLWFEGGDGGVIPPAMTLRMLTPGLGGWGLGPRVEGSGLDLQFSHGGSNEGFRAGFVAFPRRGLGAVVMTNGDGGGSLVEELLFAIAAEYEWPGYAPRLVDARPLTGEESLEFVGSYRLGDAPDIAVTVRWRGGRLELQVGEQPASELVPIGGDRFVILGDGATLGFERDGVGRVTAASAYGSRAVRERAP